VKTNVPPTSTKPEGRLEGATGAGHRAREAAALPASWSVSARPAEVA
jgi:hypothetical protein